MIAVFKKIWNFSGKEKCNVRKSLLIGFFNAVFNAFQLLAIYIALDAIIEKTASGRTIVEVVGVLIIILLGKIVTHYFSQLQQTHAGYFMSANKRISIGEKLKKVPMGFFNDNSLGELTSITTTALNEIENTVPIILVTALGSLLNSAAFILALFFFDYRIGLIAAIGAICFLTVTSFMEKKSKVIAKKRHQSQSNLVKQVLTTIQGMLVIKSYNLDGENNQMLNTAIEENCHYNLKIEKKMTPYITVQNMVVNIMKVLIIYFSIKFYIDGTMEMLNTVLVIISSFISFEQLKGAGSSMALLRVAENSIDRLNYIDEVPVMQEGKDQTPIKNFDISFKDVDFSYENKKILKNINCKMPSKNITAIIGPSGSGKTTLCNLVARFWDVDKGEVIIGGKNIKEYTLTNLMTNISIVFQNVYLFQDTIENNIKFGKPNASHEEVIEAAKKACCHDFIISLPQGYETVIDEGGTNISGGEKQRLSIARAMLKDAPIVILDEATANIDPENEDKLREAIEALTRNKTIIMIAHRLKTIRNAKQILVLDKGKIVQMGNHEQLIKEDGIYARFIGMKDKAMGWKINN